MSDEYNGYANRETWAFNLHWQNDRGMYEGTLEAARDHLKALQEEECETIPYSLGSYVVGWWQNYIEEWEREGGLPEGLRMFKDEVGSWWRIDLTEVGEAVLESLEVEA